MADNRVYSITLTFAKTDGTTQKIVGSPSIIVSHSTSASVYTQDMSNANRTGWNIALDALTFKKRMYYPCRIDATLSISRTAGTLALPKVADLKAWFVGAVIGMKADCVDGTVADVAEKYKVVDAHPSYRSNGSGKMDSLSVSLVIFSPDYLANVAKYSQVHVARKLSGIVSDSLISLGMGTTVTKDGKTTTTLDVLNTHLRFLSYDRKRVKSDDSSKEETVSDELIQPYLVQYNETFYDFLRRTANRCGEFVYYEKGKFNLGYSDSFSSDGNRAKKEKETLSITQYSTVSMRATDGIDAGISVASYHRNPVEPGTPATTLQFSGMDKLTETSSAMGIYYKLQSAYDQYLENFPKAEFDTQSDEWIAMNGSMWSNSFAKFLTSTSFIDGLGNMLLESAADWSEARECSDKAQGEFEKAYFKDKSFTTQYDIKENSGSAYSSISPFSTNSKQLDGHENVSSKLIALIHDAQMRLWNESVIIDLGSSMQDIYLGKKIKVADFSDKEYIVVEVTGGGEKPSSTEWKDTMRVVAVPYYSSGTDKPIPPATMEGPVRLSGSQTALISSSFDNDGKRLARVQIRYPWQAEVSGTPSSPWIRVLTSLAGTGGGDYFKPSVGDEALVKYEDGNIELPYVAGYMYNGTNHPSYGARFSTMISTRSGSCIRTAEFTDPTRFIDSLLPFWNLLRVVGFGMLFDDIHSDGARPLLGYTEITDSHGLVNISMSSENRRVDISAPFGEVEVDAFTGIDLSAPQGNVSIYGKNVSIVAGNNLTVTSGGNIVNKMQIHNQKSLGGAVGLLLKDAVSKFFGGLVDLSTIRTVLEFFIAPVGGTLTIKSNRFLFLEAGEGRAEIPFSAYNGDGTKGDYVLKEGGNKSQQSRVSCNLLSIRTALSVLWKEQKQRLETVRSLSRSIERLKVELGDAYTQLNGASKWKNDNLASIAGRAADTYERNATQVSYDNYVSEGLPQGYDVSEATMAMVMRYVDAVSEAYYEMKGLIDAQQSILDRIPNLRDRQTIQNKYSDVRANLEGLNLNNDCFNDIEGTLNLFRPDALSENIRRVCWKYFDSELVSLSIQNNQDPIGDNQYQAIVQWRNYVNGLVQGGAAAPATGLKAEVMKALKSIADNATGPVRDFNSWSKNDAGRILMSQVNGTTMGINDNGGVYVLNETRAALDTLLKISD